MAQAAAQPVVSKAVTRTTTVRVATVAWLLTAVYYFYQYALRSAPAVMMPQLSEAVSYTHLTLPTIYSV